MELKPGYKQTEVGVIPEDWDVSTVGNEFSIQLGKMLNSEKNIGAAKPYVGNRAVQWGRIELDGIGLIRLTSSDLQRFRLREGDLLVCEGGEIGRAAIWKRPIQECYYQKALHRLRPARGYSAQLMLSMLQRFASTGFLLNFVTQTSIAHLPKDKFEQVPLPRPATKTEQKAIAEFLSDADALTESLQQLIAKKVLIKQGAMQELLTGKKRLPGFSGEWDACTLRSVIDGLEAGVSVNSVDEDSREYQHNECILKTSAVSDGHFQPSECKKIAPQDVSRASLNPRRETIIISRMNTPELIGECAYVGEDHPLLFLPDRLWMGRLAPASKTNPRWLTYLLSHPKYKQQIKAAATGTSGSMKNLSKGAFLALPICLPDPVEQTAIASILSDMDVEIDALETKLAKARQIKQGMMQNLLTGKIRLV